MYKKSCFEGDGGEAEFAVQIDSELATETPNSVESQSSLP